MAGTGGAGGRGLSSGAVLGSPDSISLLMEETTDFGVVIQRVGGDVLGGIGTVVSGISGIGVVVCGFIGGIGGVLGGIGAVVWGILGTGVVVWSFIGGIGVILGGLGAIVGGILGIGGVVFGFIGGIGVVLRGNGVLVWGMWGSIGSTNGIIGGMVEGRGVALGGIDVVVLGCPGFSWCLSGWMKVSQVTASGPPTCVVVIRQLCRKLTGSSG